MKRLRRALKALRIIITDLICFARRIERGEYEISKTSERKVTDALQLLQEVESDESSAE